MCAIKRYTKHLLSQLVAAVTVRLVVKLIKLRLRTTYRNVVENFAKTLEIIVRFKFGLLFLLF